MNSINYYFTIQTSSNFSWRSTYYQILYYVLSWISSSCRISLCPGSIVYSLNTCSRRFTDFVLFYFHSGQTWGFYDEVHLYECYLWVEIIIFYDFLQIRLLIFRRTSMHTVSLLRTLFWSCLPLLSF